MKIAKTIFKQAVLFLIGGTAYYQIEILWRGHSHPSMFILGGLCFCIIGSINEIIPWNMGLVWQTLIGGCVITALEFCTGLIVNVWLGLGVWDYSNMPLNIMGQVCPAFFLAWLPISLVAIMLDDWIRYKIFGEDFPHYTIFSKGE